VVSGQQPASLEQFSLPKLDGQTLRSEKPRGTIEQTLLPELTTDSVS